MHITSFLAIVSKKKKTASDSQLQQEFNIMNFVQNHGNIIFKRIGIWHILKIKIFLYDDAQ